MSAFVDAQRKEDALHARVGRAKVVRLRLDDVVRLEVEGASEREMARRLAVARHRLALWRWLLGLRTRVPVASVRWALGRATRERLEDES